MKSVIQTAAFLTAILGAANTMAADAPGTEERLKQLENQVNTLVQQNDVMRKELGWTGTNFPILAKPAGKEQKLTIGGFIQGQAEFGDAKTLPGARADPAARNGTRFGGSFGG